MVVIVLLVSLICGLLFRVASVFRSIQENRNSGKRVKRTAVPIKTLVVLGSGGHTTEMLQMLKHVDPKVYSPLIYVIASTDDTSERRVKAFGGRQADQTLRIPRSREVGQSYVTSVATTLWAFVFCFWIVFKNRPNLLLCNGPGTCLPVAIAVLVFRVLGFCEGNVVFVESFCRVESLSLTGKLLYPLADMFVVHWDELHELYPRSQTISTFVPNKAKTK